MNSRKSWKVTPLANENWEMIVAMVIGKGKRGKWENNLFEANQSLEGWQGVFTGERDRVRRMYDHFKGWRGKWHQATNWKSGEGELDLLWHGSIRLILDYVAKQIQFWSAYQILGSSWPYRIFVWTYGDFFGIHDWLVVVWNMTFIFLHIFPLGNFMIPTPNWDVSEE